MDIIDLYSTRIEKSFDEDQNEIVSILKENSKKTVKLVNYYKGLPISYPATVVSVDRNTVDLDVHAIQAFAIEQSRSVFIKSPLFRHDIFANVQYVNFRKGAATFVKFCYVEILAERRNFIRVPPYPNPKTSIELPKGVAEGTLYDVSLAGLNISFDYSLEMDTDCEASARFVLHAVEQGLSVNVRVPVRLVGISGDSLPRNYRFTMFPDKMLERQLSQYVIQRQIEIIREIKDVVS